MLVELWMMMGQVELQVDLQGEARSPLPHFWEEEAGNCHAYLLTRHDLLDHVKMAHDELGFKALRFHGVFVDDVRPLLDTEDRNSVTPQNCDWWQVDLIYDSLLARGIRPFVELSFTPEPLVSDPSARIFKYQGATAPPTSWVAWEQFIELFVRHLFNRYGIEEVMQWRFEVWNEPNLKAFWKGSMEDYFRLYDHAAVAIKRVCPKIRVGGPSTACGEWVQEMIDHCQQDNFADPTYDAGNGLKSPLDFVSYHFYPTDKPLVDLRDDQGVQYLPPDRLVEVARKNYELVQQSGLPLEIHVTEWNSSSHPMDSLHDEPNQAAFICDTVRKVRPYVNSFSYWCVSDIFEEAFLPATEFHGGFGLISRHGLPKPAFQAFKFLHQLGDMEVPLTLRDAPQGVGAWCTQRGTEVELLLWNFVHPLEENPVSVDIDVNISGFESSGHEMNLSVWRINEENGNVLKRWNSLGAPNNISREELDHLRSVATLVPDHAIVLNKDGAITFDVNLPEKSVTFLKIAPRIE